MGIQDLTELFQIYSWIKEFNANFGTNLKFVVDTDTQKSRNLILINPDNGQFKKVDYLTLEQAQEFKNSGFLMFVPDLLDLKNKLIVEYQEEQKPNKGYFHAKITKKGHDELSDELKDLAYQKAGFLQLKLWENQPDKKNKLDLFEFLFTFIKRKT